MSNLVANALNHGAPDSPVTVTVSRDGKFARLAVHNLGAPIPAESLPNIFDPLKRLPDAKREGGVTAGGIGLGLFIVREVAEAHGGSVSVASERDTGTTFTVEIPV